MTRHAVATSDAAADFPIENLPFGVVRLPDGDRRVVVRIEDRVLDLAAAGIAPELTAATSLDPLLASGRGSEVRERAGEVLLRRTNHLVPVDEVEVRLPFSVGDFVDFYSSLHHATNVGRILRPASEPLLPNWRQLPVGYHSRAGTVVVSGTPVRRPLGLIGSPDGPAELAPTRALDFELEVGFVVAGPPTTTVAPDDAARHVFGAVLVNDWSARDIQALEYQPLGPFLGKSFATTISPWVVTLDALRPYLVPPPVQEPPPAPHLRSTRPWGIDLDLTVTLNECAVTTTNFGGMYWTFAQQLAHLTSNGATTRAGDLFASGTVSGPTRSEWGSLIELSWGGAEPLALPDGTVRTYLEDGDTVTMRGSCGGHGRPRIGFGEVRGTILPAEER